MDFDEILPDYQTGTTVAAVVFRWFGGTQLRDSPFLYSTRSPRRAVGILMGLPRTATVKKI